MTSIRVWTEYFLVCKVYEKVSEEISMTEFLKNKKGVIFGIANRDSIAWAVARRAAEAGADLILTYQNDLLKKRLIPLAQSIGCTKLVQCDVTQEGDIERVFSFAASCWDDLDFVLHGVAFSDKNELTGKFVDTTRANFLKTLDISCFSLVEVSKYAAQMMRHGGSIVTLSYYGAEKVIPHYNVMGVAKSALESSVRYLAADLGSLQIRVNALSCGPIKTLAAAGGIDGFGYILKWTQDNAPLGRGVSQEDVGDAALYYFSALSKAITGTVHYVDAGYHVVGMKSIHAPDLVRV
jgi:enoyl-[acyl-carrier protein] reductase I